MPSRRSLGPLGLSGAFLLVAAGLLVQSAGYSIGWRESSPATLALFFTGLMIIFLACAPGLIGARAGRSERLVLSVILALGLLVSYYLRSPYLFDGFDELLHETTLWQLGTSHALFTRNTELPISPYFPGLELCTLAVRWLTGLPLVLCELVTVALSRVLLVCATFLFVERVCRSPVAGGAGVLVVAASPGFYAFEGQYAYETLAIGLVAAAAWLVLSAGEAATLPDLAGQPGRRAGRLRATLACWRPATSDIAFAAVVILAAAVTHHLTSWALVLLLAIVAAVLAATRRPGAGLVAALALFAIVANAGWDAISGARLWSYLGPLLTTSADRFGQLFLGHAGRNLFVGNSGITTPLWERVTMLAGAVLWCAVIVVAGLAALRRHTVRGGWLAVLAVVVACAYPAVLASRLAPASDQVGIRASAFVFFGVAVIVGGWLASRTDRSLSSRRFVAVACVVAGTCFLGSMLLGSGPDFSYVPGKYLVEADNRSVTAASIEAARWEASHLPAGSPIAADRDNAALAAAVGHLDPVTTLSGGVDVTPLYFDRSFGSYDLSIVLRGDVRFLLVDDRLTSGLPIFGSYFQSGTSGNRRLTAAELAKFDSIPGVRRIYSNGPIQIYDLSALLGDHSAAADGRGSIGGWGDAPDYPVLGLALAVLLAWAWRLRRVRPDAGAVFRGCTAFVVASIFGALALVRLHVSPTVIGVAALCVLGALSFVGRHDTDESRTPGARAVGRSSSRGARRWPAALVTVTGAVVLAAACTTAAVAEHRALVASPPELWVTVSPTGHDVAHLEVPPGTKVSRDMTLVVTAPGAPERRIPVRSASEQVVINGPQSYETRIALVRGRQLIRVVSG